MTFKQKLLVAFCAMAFPTAVVVGLAALHVHRERATLRRLESSLSRARTFGDLESLTYRKVRKIRDYVSGLDAGAKADFERLDAEWRSTFSDWNRGSTTEVESSYAARYELLDGELRKLAARLFSSFEAGRGGEARQAVQDELNASLLPSLDHTITTIYGISRTRDVQGAFRDLDAATRSTTLLFVVVALLAIAVSGAFSIVVARNLARPVEQLKRAMDAVAEGGLDRPPSVDLTGNDEIGDLARAFARMSDRLGRAQQDLRHKIDTLRETQSQLVQSEKLASLGEMAAAVAHGLRNPLASIRAAAQLSLRRLPAESPHREQLGAVIEEVDRLSTRIAHLLDFARPAAYVPAPTSLRALLEPLASAFGDRLSRQGVDLRLDCDASVPEAWVDPSQVEQAVIELVSNALDAMPNGGRLSIAAGRPGDGDGGIELTVSDTGEGIPKEALARVGEPFYTTKADGTGLGVAIAKRFVEQNKGTFAISCLEPGTRVTIRLPALPADGASAA